MRDIVKEWEESGLLKGVPLKEQKKTLAMSLENTLRRLKVMAMHTPEDVLYPLERLAFCIVRRLVVNSGFEPITNFAGLFEHIQKEWKKFNLQNDAKSFCSALDMECEFMAAFCEEHAGLF